MIKQSRCSRLGIIGAVVLVCTASPARAVSPYTVDADTLHLWHFNEAPVGTLPVITATEEGSSSTSLNVTNGASLMAPAYSVALDGSLDTQAGTEVIALNDTLPYDLDNHLTGANGSFTYEALVWPAFDPAVELPGRGSEMSIICFDSESAESTNRFFQFRLNRPDSASEPWSVEFANIGSYVAPVGSNEYAFSEAVEDFSGDLGSWTSTVILDANGGGSNTSSWNIVSGELQLSTTGYEGIEQYAFIKSGVSLAVGDELRVDLTHSGASQDIGLYVGGTTPVTGTRQDYVAVYARGDGAVYSRGFDGTSEYGLAGGTSPAYDTLFIARSGANTYETGYYESGVRNVIVTRTPTTANDADVVGIYADVRAAGDLGLLDNLEIWEQTAVGIPAQYGETFLAPLPTNGVNAAAASNWYHVAVTYNGSENTADNLRIYWTKLDASATGANEIGSFQMTNDIANVTIDRTGEFSVGNESRGTSSENFVGLIDEVRVSKTARAVGGFNLTGTPYASDADTLLLFHFDDTHDTVPGTTDIAYDAVTTNPLDLRAYDGPVFGTNAYTGFGSAIGFDQETNPGNRLAAFEDTAVSMSNLVDAATGAFTFEAVIQPRGSSGTMTILSAEGDGDTIGRPFQFRIQDGTTLRFDPIATRLNGGGTDVIDVPLPASGTHTFSEGDWYHVAIAYDGNESGTNNVTFYWTRLASGATEANVLTNVTAGGDLINPAHSGEFCVGNELRDNGGFAVEEFIGSIDEVRISKIVRAATEFVFADGGVVLDPYDITSIVVFGGNAALTWESQSGATYKILRKTDLTGSTWNEVKTGIASAGDGTTSDSVTVSGADEEFYRVQGE